MTDREAVAREIDGGAFKSGSTALHDRREAALAAADRLIARWPQLTVPTVPEGLVVTDAMIDRALRARVPGGSNVMDWLPLVEDEHGRPNIPHQTAKDVMRSALSAALTQKGE